MLAYILMLVKAGKEKKVAEKLMELEGIKEVHILYGQYDLIAKASAENVHALNELVLKAVRTIRGIESTSTLICANTGE